MGFVFLVFVFLLLILTGFLGPLIVFSSWTLLVFLGLWLLVWAFWRGITSNPGIVAVIFVAFWFFEPVIARWIDVIFIVGALGAAAYFALRKRDPKWGDIEYPDWIKSKEDRLQALKDAKQAEEAQWREEDQLYEWHKQRLVNEI